MPTEISAEAVLSVLARSVDGVLMDSEIRAQLAPSAEWGALNLDCTLTELATENAIALGVVVEVDKHLPPVRGVALMRCESIECRQEALMRVSRHLNSWQMQVALSGRCC
jgi:hypothetical protein